MPKAIFEVGDWANLFGRQKSVCFFGRNFVAGNMLVQTKLAFRIQAIIDPVCLLENFVFAHRANGVQVRKDRIHFCFGIVACLDNQFGCQLLDFVHEIFAAKVSLLHLFELVLPFTRHLWAAKRRDPDVVQQVNQGQSFV